MKIIQKMSTLVCAFFYTLTPCANTFLQTFSQLINVKIFIWRWSWEKIIDSQFHDQILTIFNSGGSTSQARSRYLYRGLTRADTPQQDDGANPEIVYSCSAKTQQNWKNAWLQLLIYNRKRAIHRMDNCSWNCELTQWLQILVSKKPSTLENTRSLHMTFWNNDGTTQM